MKKRIYFVGIAVLALALLTMSSCKQGKTTETAQTTDSRDSTDTSADNEAAAEATIDQTDIKAFGLKGNVAKAVIVRYEATLDGDKLVRGAQTVAANDSLVTFNEKGQVTLDEYANPYVYDADGKFVRGRSKVTEMKRDEKGRVVSYKNRENSNHWEGYEYEFKYDEQGRITTIEWGGWEEGTSWTKTYDGDNVYPSKEQIDGQACAEIYKTTINYRYLTFDNNGNWTERELYLDEMETSEEYEGNENPAVNTSKHYFIETRTITYY